MPQGDGLLRHLRHAEEWLGLARRDYRRGDRHSAMLRLMLAEAEVRRARETGLEPASETPGTHPGRPPAVLVGAITIATVVCAAFVAAARITPARGPSTQATASTIPVDVVRLDAGGLLARPAGPEAYTLPGDAPRLFGVRVVQQVVIHSRWFVSAPDGAVTLFPPSDAGRPAGTF